MITHTSTPKKLTTWCCSALVTLAIYLPVGLVQAGEMALKGKEVGKTTEVTWLQIGDDESHGIGTYQVSWLIFLEDGQVGTATDKGTFESNKGVGTHQGYYVTTFPDGSKQMLKYHGTSKPIVEKTNAIQGISIYIGGTGRFEGMKGEGTYTGTQYDNGMYSLDFDAKVTVPD